MKTIFFAVCMAGLIFSCDAPNQSSEQGAGSELEEQAPADPSSESENRDIHSDTTTTGGVNRQNPYDTLK